MKTGAVLQAALKSYRVGYDKQEMPALDMGCALKSRDVKNPGGIPYSVLGEEAIGSWLSVGAAFVGEASPVDEGGALLPALGATVTGICALTLGRERVLGIVDADDEAGQLLGMRLENELKQSVWFAVPRADISVTTEGRQGLFTKRPVLIEISTEHWSVHLRHVIKLTRACTPDIAFKHNSGQPRGENSLVAALGAG